MKARSTEQRESEITEDDRRKALGVRNEHNGTGVEARAQESNQHAS